MIWESKGKVQGDRVIKCKIILKAVAYLGIGPCAWLGPLSYEKTNFCVLFLINGKLEPELGLISILSN